MDRFIVLFSIFSIHTLFIVSCSEKKDAEPTIIANQIEIIDGYTNKLSYQSTDSISIYINASDSGAIPIFFNDLNGKKIREFQAYVFPQKSKNEKPWENGYQYKLTSRFDLSTIPSGIYLINGKLPFFIQAEEVADITVIYPSNTVNAYSLSGGLSFYGESKTGRPAAQVISFNRPQDHFVRAMCWPFLKWLSNQEYSLNVISDRDADSYENLSKGSICIVPGHSEYWTRSARENFDKFVGNGGNALVISGNTMWWHVRYEDHKLICYKIHEPDPTPNPLDQTTLWNTESLKYPILRSIGVDFKYGGYGLKEDKGWDGFKIIDSSFIAFNGIDSLENGIILLGSYELDGAPIIKNDMLEIPQIDEKKLGFYDVRLLAYDRTFRLGKHGFGTAIYFRKNETSGEVINFPSTNWCSTGFTDDNQNIEIITKNSINYLLDNN